MAIVSMLEAVRDAQLWLLANLIDGLGKIGTVGHFV